MKTETDTRTYDIIFAGGGAAALSLAVHLVQSPLSSLSMLIVDPDPKQTNDRTWCFWGTEPIVFESIVRRRWSRLAFVSDNVELTMHPEPYDYRVIHSIDFYRHTRAILEASGRVTFLNATVADVYDAPPPGGSAPAGSTHTDDAEYAEVVVDGITYRASWVFDSRWTAIAYRGTNPRRHYLQQHFLGWTIRTPEDRFDPECATLFDLRVPQEGTFRFVYTLPFTRRDAMVEYTLFSADLLAPHEYRDALDAYLREQLGITAYEIVEEESCVIPMTDEPFPREGGRRVMRIGTRGGRVKASTGYAFLRIQQDSAAIVRSLIERGTPYHRRRPPPRYALFDSMLLQILHRRGDRGKEVFTALFTRNPVQRIFRFLDEVGSIRENLALMASVPWFLFIRAWITVRFARKV